MTHWVRVFASGIYGTPFLLVGLLMMLFVWFGAAEIYAAAIQMPHRGESPALMLGALNALGSWPLVFGFLRLRRDLRELRIPMHRRLLAVAVAVIFGLVVVLPCGVVWSLNGGPHDLVIVAMGSVVGTAAMLLWEFRPRIPASLADRLSAATTRPSGAVTAPTAWRAMRMALGPPFAPASWRWRLMQLASLCTLVVGAPLLVELFRSLLNPRGFIILLHIAQFAILMPALVVCWIWPMSRVFALFISQGGSLTELALLPGLGRPRQQLRRFFLVALSVPTGALAALLVIALGVATQEHLPHAILIKLTVIFFLIPVITLPLLVGQIAKKRPSGAWSPALLIFSQGWTFFVIVTTGSWDVLVTVTPRWLTIAVVIAAMSFIGGMTGYLFRKLAFRPHPFVDVSE